MFLYIFKNGNQIENTLHKFAPSIAEEYLNRFDDLYWELNRLLEQPFFITENTMYYGSNDYDDTNEMSLYYQNLQELQNIISCLEYEHTRQTLQI